MEFIILGIFPSLILFSNNILYGQQQQEEHDVNVNVNDSKPEFIAIQHAQSGSISKVNATTNFLELQNVSNPILFSDRPDRIVKTESTQQFLDRW